MTKAELQAKLNEKGITYPNNAKKAELEVLLNDGNNNENQESFNDRPHKNEKAESIEYVKSLIEQMRAEGKSDDIPKLEKLIQLLDSKKYGLVWEEHAELVEEEMKTKIPVFVEDESKKIHDNPDSEDFNFLLEGDNLHSLHLLEKTHAGRIDVIYIDPPYNTGNKDFKYNDAFVDDNDTFSHSKWLSFMERRLRIARTLLSDDGVIFISIDDNEQSQLRMLMNEIFGEGNFVGTFFWNKTSTPPALSKTIRRKFEFVISYSNNRNSLKLYGGQTDGGDVPLLNNGNNLADLMVPKEAIQFKLKDGIYPAQKYDGIELLEEIEVKNNYSLTDVKMRGKFKWQQSMLDSEIEKGTYLIVKTIKMSVRFQRSETTVKIPSDLLSKDENGVSTNEQGKKDFQQLIENNDFDYTKPVSLIKYLSTMVTHFNKNTIILDFFAGSGTTGQAVTELNAEDGGSRKFILATNNENNIAEEVTYERMKRVSSGTEKYEAKPLNLKYFKTDFVVKEEFPDVSLEFELLKYITPLVELEFAIDITNPKVQIVLNEDQLENLIEKNEMISNSTLFMHPDVFRDAEQNQILNDLQIKVQEIPNYFFGKELWSK